LVFCGALLLAHDADFSAAQIAQFVLPYFQGVQDALDAASGGMSVYRVGVYGSGLECRTLRDAGLACFSWLAESRGWRESATYTGWNIKQFVTDEPLCDLGNGWQRCTAKAQFGQFRPLDQ
jgi:hypothetical protein